MSGNYPPKKVTIIGGGMIGAIEALYLYLNAKKNNETVRVTVMDMVTLSETTVSNIVPSLTPDEILSVVPRGKLLIEKLGILFSLPGGIRVDDVANVNDSPITQQFIEQVQLYSADDLAHSQRTAALLQLGKLSMDIWTKIYQEADPELRQILEDSNFNPCRELSKNYPTLHDGYRIDLIANIPNAALKASAMRDDYLALGYNNCKLLSPDEVIAMDPFLEDFCANHTTVDADGTLIWNDDTVALFRPGGCLDTQVFLPKLYAYLTKKMGTYINNEGVEKPCFKIKFNRKVDGVVYNIYDNNKIIGVNYDNVIKINKHAYDDLQYVFCPGAAVGTLDALGFAEPAYAGFAGASLLLNIPVPNDKLSQYSSLNHCMEVHREGVVLAWQARFRENKIFIGVAGTKSFYADQTPHKDQAFAKDRNLLQLNMINDVLPEFVSLALGRDTYGEILTEADLLYLEEVGIATRWVGTRAVAYDGFPTFGALYNEYGVVSNATCITHAGSGGGSFSPALVWACNKSLSNASSEFVEQLEEYASSSRKLKPM